VIRIWTRVARAYLATFVSASEQAKYAAVSIALAALFVGCFDESSAGCLDLGDASAYFRLEPRVDDRQSRGGGDVLNAVRLVLWHNGHMRDLGTFGGTYGVGNWLNDEGEVVGQSNLAGDQVTRPFLWNGRKMINLGDLGGGFGFANYVNERGDVAGASLAPDGNFHGFRWHEGHMIDLPPVGRARWAFADSINMETRPSVTKPTWEAVRS
jgi:probable HAF family extracellular repeat protein